MIKVCRDLTITRKTGNKCPKLKKPKPKKSRAISWGVSSHYNISVSNSDRAQRPNAASKKKNVRKYYFVGQSL
jgi:hypothetical protein